MRPFASDQMRLLVIGLALLLLIAIFWPAKTNAESCPPTEQAWAILDQIGGPGRFELRHGCITVTGVSAGQVMETADGELHTFLIVDPEWRNTFNPNAQPGEPVIIDTELHTGGDWSKIQVAWVDQRVSITGALVYDRLRGYGRINPVWAIE